MISIPLEQPPQTVTPEVAEYLERMFIQIQAAFAESEYQIAKLESRIKTLESKP